MLTLPITKEQAQYLNTVARIANKNRVTNERMQRDLVADLDRVNKGLTPNGVRQQDLADIMHTTGQLDALESTLYLVFPFPTEGDDRAHEATVAAYYKEAVKLGDGYIFMQH